MEEIRTRLIELYNCLDNISWDISDAKESLDGLEISIKEKENNSIKDLDNFKRQLKRDGLYSDKLEEFLDDYMKYYNK